MTAKRKRKNTFFRVLAKQSQIKTDKEIKEKEQNQSEIEIESNMTNIRKSSRNCQKHLSVDVLNLLTQSEKNDLIKCKTCETMIDGEGGEYLACNFCSILFCVPCTEVSYQMYQLMMNDKDCKLSYTCNACKEDIPILREIKGLKSKQAILETKVQEITTKQGELDKDVVKNTNEIDRIKNCIYINEYQVKNIIESEYSDRINNLVTRIEGLENSTNKTEHTGDYSTVLETSTTILNELTSRLDKIESTNDNTSREVPECIRENKFKIGVNDILNQRKERENNILIFGLPETENNEQSKQYDNNLVKEVITHVTQNTCDVIIKRLGKKSDDSNNAVCKPRPMLINFCQV